MADRSDRVRSPSQPLTMSSDDDDDNVVEELLRDIVEEILKLPEDIVKEILKRLPVKSLLRFKRVFPSSSSIIDDRGFVNLHMEHSALDAANWHLVCLDWGDPRRNLCSLLSGESLARPSLSQIEIPFGALYNCYRLVGSCNGLTCVTKICENGYGWSFFLWNVFTGKHKVVPRFSPESIDRAEMSAAVALGFGFDASPDGYKIVRILYLPDDSKRVEIYSLCTDSWRSLECEVPAFCAYTPSVFFNGNLHWLVDKRDDRGYKSIVLFSVASEVFDKRALSEELLPIVRGSSVVSLSVLNDLLAVCAVHSEAVVHSELHSVCSVWVMSEYGIPKSWTELYSFEARGRVTGLDGFTRKGELLMVIDDKRVSWNPITEQFADLLLPRRCGLVTVLESLVSL